MAILSNRFSGLFYDVRAWAHSLSSLERQACIVQTNSSKTTGFLVGPDIVMTAAHIFRNQRQQKLPLETIRVQFDYDPDSSTSAINPGLTVGLAEEGALLALSPTVEGTLVGSIDTVVLRLADKIGIETDNPRGWVRLAPDSRRLELDDGLAIIGHPQGGPLQLSINTHSVIGYDEQTRHLMYRTDTSPGLSGAPCFDLDWGFVAMHQGRSPLANNYNVGIPSTLIVDWLRNVGIWEEVSQEPPSDVSIGSRVPYPREREAEYGIPFELRRLMRENKEGELLEYKESWVGAKDNCLKAIASFLNSRSGGTLLLGVADDGTITGIERDYEYANRQKADWDGFSLSLIDSLGKLDSSGNVHDFIRVERYKEKSKDICAIIVRPSDRPVFLGKRFYQRVGNQSRLIEGHSMLHYVAGRWSWLGSIN